MEILDKWAEIREYIRIERLRTTASRRAEHKIVSVAVALNHRSTSISHGIHFTIAYSGRKFWIAGLVTA